MTRYNEAFWRALVMVAFVWLVGILWALHGAEGFTATAVVIPENTVTYDGLRFYQLDFGDGGRVLVTADAHTPLAQALAQMERQKVRVELTPVRLERIER